MSSSLKPEDTFVLDSRQIWKLLPKRLPGRIKEVWRNPELGRIEPLITVNYPDGKPLDGIFSRELINYTVDDLVVFEYKPGSFAEKRKQGQPDLIEAYRLELAEQEEVTKLIEQFNYLLGTEIQRQLKERLEKIQLRLQNLDEEIQTRVEAEVSERTKSLEEREQKVSSQKVELETRERRLQEDVERLVTEGIARERYELDKEQQRIKLLESDLTSRLVSLEERERQIQAERNVLVEAQVEFEAKGGPAYIEYVRALDGQPSSDSVPDALEVTEIPHFDEKQIVSHLSESGYQTQEALISQAVLAALAAWSSGQFVVLSGPTGVGKTQLVKQLARIVGAGYGIISVRPSWVEPADLLGFYNAMHKLYEPTPFIDHVLRADSYREANRLYFLCLDEMNLSRVENYAADLLSKMESASAGQKATINLFSSEIAQRLREEEQLLLQQNGDLSPESHARMHSLTRQLQRYRSELNIPQNLTLFGTVNVDETTQIFSPKFLDRAYVVRFPPVTLTKRLSDFSDEANAQKTIWPLPLNELQTLISNGKRSDSPSVKDIWSDFLDWQKYLDSLDLHFGYRFAASFQRYMAIGARIGIDDVVRLGDYFFQAKMLPRIRFGIQERASGGVEELKLDQLENWRDKLNRKRGRKYPGLVKILSDMLDRSANRGMVEFWE